MTDTDDITLGQISDAAIRARIKSFEYRQTQNTLLIESNALSIQSLKFKLNGNHEKSTEHHLLAINKKNKSNDAKIMSARYIEKSVILDRCYFRAMEMLNDDWQKYIKIDDASN